MQEKIKINLFTCNKRLGVRNHERVKGKLTSQAINKRVGHIVNPGICIAPAECPSLSQGLSYV